MKPKRLLILLLYLLPVSHLSGQEFAEANFVHYTTAEGLSNNAATSIAQDSAGYVWISTLSGLNRYNGSQFVQFHSNSDSLSLPGEELIGMTWLDKYRLSVYTAGLHIIDTRTGKTRNLFIPYHDKQYQYKFNMLASVMGDEEGNIYILSRSGFYHFNKDYELVSRFDYYTDSQVPVKHFVFGRYLHELDNNRFLIVSTDGLYIYDKRKKAVKKMVSADCPPLSQFLDYPGSGITPYHFFQVKPGCFFVLSLMSDSLIYVDIAANRKTVSNTPIKRLREEFHYRSKLIVASDTVFYLTGHSSGFFKIRFYPETGAVKFYARKYFPSYLCFSLMIDKDKNLWVASNRGLLRQDLGRSQVQLAPFPKRISDSLPNVRFDDIYVAGDKVYAATRDHGGLLLFDKKTFQFTEQIIETKFTYSNLINSIISATPTTLLLGTGDRPFLFDITTKKETAMLPPKWEDGYWTSDLFKDSKGKIWISAVQIYRYDPVARTYELIPSYDRQPNLPTAIREDHDGNMWMAGHGIVRYNTVLGRFDKLVDSFPFIKMHDKQVNEMVIDEQNTIWFNPYNNGLVAYCIDKGTFRHFTRANGLPDDNIASMIIIGKKLWISCYSALACLDLQTGEIISFGKEDGFPQMPVIRGARFFYDSTAQQLYLGFSHAIARFNPYDILRKKSPPQVFIESLSINGDTDHYLPSTQITTSWKDNEIMIRIGSINFSGSYSQRFAYRILKDNNTPWQQLGSQPSFSISNLSPGTYRIQVKSFSLNNRWPPQVKEISIVVLPPFWMKEWFIVSMAALSVVLLYLLIRWRTGLARKKEMEKTHIQKLKADHYKNELELEYISNYFTSSLSGKNTEEEVLWDVASNLIGKMNYVDCMIYLWNEDKTKMIQKAAYGPKGKPEFISANVFDVLPGQGVVGHVIQTQQPVLIDDTRKDSRYRVDEEFRLSEVCVPIIHNGELMGIIDSEHYQPGYFSDRDIKILTTIATLIANKLKQIGSEQSLEVKQKELVTINEQLAEARLAALQAQMNPHFVFNALNSIKRMILDSDNDKASRYLSKFALMIRMTLNHSKEIFVTLDENIEYLKAYLEMEQLRFDDSFKYSIFIGENIDTDETSIPSLMIQPLVENAIWHGLMQAEGDKKVRIGFTNSQNKITCTIEDNGIGIRQSEKIKEINRPLHQSTGLENLQKRIKIMNEKYDMDCSLIITDLADTGNNNRGTRVVLQFNMVNI